jgi:hypothetical protein
LSSSITSFIHRSHISYPSISIHQPTMDSTQLATLNAFFDRVVSEDRRVLIFVVSIETAPIFVQAVRSQSFFGDPIPLFWGFPDHFSSIRSLFHFCPFTPVYLISLDHVLFYLTFHLSPPQLSAVHPPFNVVASRCLNLFASPAPSLGPSHSLPPPLIFPPLPSLAPRPRPTRAVSTDASTLWSSPKFCSSTRSSIIR